MDDVTNLLKICQDRPDLFNELFLDRPAYWSRQMDLCRSVVDYRTTVAYSGNMVGKDYWIAGIILWWLLTRPNSLCIITGPSQMVLGSVTFKEIRRCLEGAVLPFGGKLSSGIKASPAVIEIAPGWQALGFSTTSVERSSGQHAKHLLAVVEEASGVEDFVFDAIDSLGYERLVCIGNPIRAEGKFVDLIRQAARDRAEETPPRLAVNADSDSEHGVPARASGEKRLRVGRSNLARQHVPQVRQALALGRVAHRRPHTRRRRRTTD